MNPRFCAKHQHAFINICTECVKEEQVNGMPPHNIPNGFYSNQRMTQRNRGILPQFVAATKE
jgi:hypothetical protein